MTHIHRTAIMALFSLVLVFGLSRLPATKPDASLTRGASAVFSPIPVIKLTDDTLPDAMVTLPLTDRLLRVNWDPGILTVDLGIATQDAVPADLWKDARELIAFSFTKVTNVRHLLIRLYDESENGRVMLGSADTRVTDWTPDTLAELAEQRDDSVPDGTVKLRFSWTPAGKQWLQSFANS